MKTIVSFFIETKLLTA